MFNLSARMWRGQLNLLKSLHRAYATAVRHKRIDKSEKTALINLMEQLHFKHANDEIVRRYLEQNSTPYQVACIAISAAANLYPPDRSLRKTKQIFDRILEHKVNPTTTIYNSLIKAYANNGEYQEAKRIYKEMTTPRSFKTQSEDTNNELKETYHLQPGLKPSLMTFTHLIHAASLVGDSNGVIEHYNQMKELTNSRVPPADNIIADMLHASMKAEDGNAISDVITNELCSTLSFAGAVRMLELGLTSNNLSFVRLMHSVLVEKFRHENFDIGTRMKILRVAANIEAHTDESAVELASTQLTHIMKILNENDSQLTAIQRSQALHAMLLVYTNAKSHCKALSFMNEMINSGVPVHLHYKELLANSITISGSSEIEKCYDFIESLRTEGGTPVAAECLDVLIEACALYGDRDLAFAIFTDYENYNLKPQAEAYCGLMLTCLHDAEEGKKFLKPGFGRRYRFDPDQLPAALSILEQMEHDNVKPTERTQRLLVHACVSMSNNEPMERKRAAFQLGLKIVNDMYDKHKIICPTSYSRLRSFVNRSKLEEEAAEFKQLCVEREIFFGPYILEFDKKNQQSDNVREDQNDD